MESFNEGNMNENIVCVISKAYVVPPRIDCGPSDCGESS